MRANIQGGSCPARFPWKVPPQSLVLIDGRYFVVLRRFDIGFLRFLSGAERTDYQGRPSKAVELMVAHRCAATRAAAEAATSGAGEGLFDEEGESQSAATATGAKRHKVQKNLQTEATIIDVEFPSFEVDGKTVEGIKASVVASDDMSNPLTIHLTDQNLSYVWELHQKEGFGEPMRERKLPRGVYHNPKRYQFVVAHPNKDKS